VSSTGRRLAVVIEYDGSGFAGWQSQAHSASIQDVVQQALGFVAGHPIDATCAGRTDSGVHALGQVAHFDTHALRSSRAWVLGANTRLPPTVALQWAGEVDSRFHARHSALRRIYRYCILNRSARSALQVARAAWIHRPVDAAAMHAGAQALLGEHDFSAFRSVECQSKTPMRRIDTLQVQREGDYVWIEITANAYLHHMVRNIVGTLLEVQAAPDPAGAMRGILESGARRLAGATAPAAGLYLWQVTYAAHHGIPLPSDALLLRPRA
jgi:tRNA pseudouridine38-40 synthase